MLKIFNTLSREKEEFRPIKDKEVGIYTCGPTVYNHAHIGNLRAYTSADILTRYLKYRGFKVNWVLNITDVDDKTIRDSKKEGITLKDFTLKYEKIFFEDIEKLNIKKENFSKTPRATEHIKEMQEIIEKLLEKGIAYESDGAIYFSIQKYIENGGKYGRLQNIELDKLKVGERVEADEYEKEDANDFVLWKGKKEDDEPSWDFKINGKNLEGRPGWHIECSAMSTKYLGDTFDIHTGGIDLIFPHHEDEIAQTEGATGKSFANYFVHNEHLLVNGQKMSKSLGNFYTLEDIEKMVKNPLALRYLFLQSHYRSKLDFSEVSLLSAENTLHNIYDFMLRLRDINNNISNNQINLSEFTELINKALDDDLNTPLVLSAIHKLMSDTNRIYDNLSKKESLDIYNFMIDIDEVLGLGLEEIKQEEISGDIQKLIDEREEARKNNDFEKSDKIRDELRKKGIELEDTKDGARWRKIS